MKAAAKRTHAKKPCSCVGYKLELNGSSPFISYPFGLHPLLDLPWMVFIDDDSLTLRSHKCLGDATPSVSSCSSCSSLCDENVVLGIQKRLQEGPHKSTCYKYQNFGDLIELLKSKNAQINELKLGKLNLEHSLVVCA